MPSRAQQAAIRAAAASGAASVPVSVSGIGTTAYNGNGVTLTGITVPAASATGEFMLMMAVEGGGNFTTQPAIAGWTSLGICTITPGTAWRFGLWWRIKQAGDTTFSLTYTGSNTKCGARIISYAGVNTSSPFDVAPTMQTTAMTGSLTPSAQTVTTLLPESMIVTALADFASNSPYTTVISNSFITDIIAAAGDVGASYEMDLAHKTLSVAGAMGATTWTIPSAGTSVFSVTFALKKA